MVFLRAAGVQIWLYSSPNGGSSLDVSQVFAIINSLSWIFVVTWTISTLDGPGQGSECHGS